MIKASIEWPTGAVDLQWLPQNSTGLPVTGSHGIIFGNSGILVAMVRSRGMTIPGGHIESNESPEQCVVREISEEVQVEVGQLVLVGYILSDHSANSDYTGPYPVRSVQAIYTGNVTKYQPFRPTAEVSGRKEVSPTELPELHHEWNAVLGAALAAATIAS